MTWCTTQIIRCTVLRWKAYLNSPEALLSQSSPACCVTCIKKRKKINTINLSETHNSQNSQGIFSERRLRESNGKEIVIISVIINLTPWGESKMFPSMEQSCILISLFVWMCDISLIMSRLHHFTHYTLHYALMLRKCALAIRFRCLDKKNRGPVGWPSLSAFAPVEELRHIMIYWFFLLIFVVEKKLACMFKLRCSSQRHAPFISHPCFKAREFDFFNRWAFVLDRGVHMCDEAVFSPSDWPEPGWSHVSFQWPCSSHTAGL